MNNNINKYISQEKVYYRIPDQYLQQIRNNNIPIIIDHNHYYCIISMCALYKLFPHNQNIRVKYYCEKCNNIHIIDCQSITRKVKKSDGHLYCPKCMKCYSLYKYSTNGIPTSKQQVYFASLFKNTILNYPVDKLFIDIALPEQKIGIEYNGSGHDLAVKLNHISHQQFIRKEWSRRMILQKDGWKIIYIINPKDHKINLYTDDEYKKIFTYINKYLLKDDIIELYIADNRILTHTKMIYINDILTNNLPDVKNIQIFSIKQAIKYLHISTKTFYKAKIPVNITPYNFRYYTQEQLDEYINSYGKIGNNYLLTKEAAEYLHTSVNKVKLLQDIKQLYPYVINDEYYFHIKQLDQCMQSHILDNYFSTDDAVKYLAKYNINKVVHTLRNDNNLPATYIINQQKFYTQEQLDEYIAKQQYISSLYTRKQAAEYLHMSLATLDRKKETGELVPVEKGYLYSKEQLDKYMTDNGIDINSNYLSLNEVFDKYSAKYNFSKRQLEHWVEDGKVVSKLIARKYYICENDIEHYLQSLQIDEKYMSRSDILAKYDITKGQLRYAMENKKIRVIKQNGKLFYNSNDVKLYIATYNDIKAGKYLNTEECLKYLDVNLNTLRGLSNLNLIKPSYATEGRKYYSQEDLDYFLQNESNLLINIKDAHSLIMHSKSPLINILIDKCNQLSSVVIKRFTYIKCDDFISIISKELPLIETKNAQDELRVIKYRNKDYVFQYQYESSKKKYISRLVNIVNTYRIKKTNDELNRLCLYTAAEAAEFLNITKSKLYYLLQTGKLKNIKTRDNTYIALSELEHYKHKNDINDLLTFNDALQYLKVSHNTLEKRLKQAGVVSHIINNKRFFHKEDIEHLK